MFVYVSMMIWTALCGLIGKGSEAIYIEDGKTVKKANYLFVLLTMGYIILFMGTLVGFADLSLYEIMYNHLPTEPSEISKYMDTVKKYPLFYYLQVLFKCYVSDNFSAWLTVIVSFDCLVIGYVFRKYSSDFFLSIFIFIASGKFFWMGNGVKQFWANCIILLFCGALFKKKFWIYAFAVILASYFHTSALVALPVYFFVHGKPWNKKMMLILAGTLLSVTFLSTFTDFLNIILESSDYDADVLLSDSGSNILHVFIAAVPSVIALIGKKRIENIAPSYINVCINMSIVTTCFYFISAFTAGIQMGRIPIYFELYGFIALPWLLKNSFNEETAKTVRLICIILYLIVYFLIFFRRPYYSYFLGIFVTP